MTQGKRWLFTLNNYSEEERLGLVDQLPQYVDYFIIGRERGAEGTPHLQGYCEFKQRHRLSSLKNTISSRAHWESARGTGRDNRNYCSKDGDFTEHGTLSNYRRGDSSSRDRPTRDELAREFAARADARDLSTFAQERPGTWYFSGSTLLRNYTLLREPLAREGVTVKWFHGPPGTGKSKTAHETLPQAYMKDARTKWWNGYMFQTDVIIDDFGPNGIDITRLLVWFDRYKCTVETKGGMLALCATTFIVTSNFSPEVVYTDNMGVVHPQLPALIRRITCIQY